MVAGRSPEQMVPAEHSLRRVKTLADAVLRDMSREQVLLENRNGLIVALEVAEANGFAERQQALQFLDRAVPGRSGSPPRGDRGYDTKGFVAECRDRRVTRHVAQNEKGSAGSAIDRRTTRNPDYRVSQRFRVRIEEIFG